MLQDVLAKRPTEIAALNGGIVQFGKQTGRPDAVERSYLGPDREPGSTPGRVTTIIMSNFL